MKRNTRKTARRWLGSRKQVHRQELEPAKEECTGQEATERDC